MARRKKATLITCILTSILSSVWLGWCLLHQSYPDTKNLDSAYQKVLSAKAGEKTILIFHKPGCSRCEGAKKDVQRIIQDFKHKDKELNFVVINVDQAKAKPFMNHFSVGRYPYFIVLNGQQEKGEFSAVQYAIIKKKLELNLQEETA